MPDILTEQEYKKNKEYYLMKISSGAVFIYPTDTIYGIGCDAKNSEAVQRLRFIKERSKKPLSVIAPNKEWISRNCFCEEEYLNKLPGPYTLILKLKHKDCISKFVNLETNNLGVRIPKHWITEIAELLQTPIVTSSANISGHNFMTEISNLDKTVKERIDFIIYAGQLQGKPSTIIDLTKENPKIIKR